MKFWAWFRRAIEDLIAFDAWKWISQGRSCGDGQGAGGRRGWRYAGLAGGGRGGRGRAGAGISAVRGVRRVRAGVGRGAVRA
ncbi:hypothetical protein FRACA_1700002 [Frankia canadensis]|uniref:Uncharacterized protein n=1 Tax=Frankia canadensis TaxID=1836972 RepID=A0A2I2KN70_9ACTN|nr:hypothetical protein FRACA_1700002 [Frankia canadensis]SOU54400.1 hypothetical protein FRACA_1700002 [Frankia canadensis]